MLSEIISFRPRNGMPVEAYWRIRRWCVMNGFNFSDVLNAVIIPLAYYLENFCEIDHHSSVATVEMNIGELPIYHVRNDSILKLEDAAPLEEIDAHIVEWKERNSKMPSFVDIKIAQHGIKKTKTTHPSANHR